MRRGFAPLAALTVLTVLTGLAAAPAGAVTSTLRPATVKVAVEATALAMRVDSPAAAHGAVAVSDPSELSVRAVGAGLAAEAINVAADLHIYPASGERLSVGSIPAAGAGTSPAPGTVMVSAGSNGGSCIIEAGTPVHVIEADYADDGTLARLAVDVTGRCVGFEPLHELRLRYRSSVPYAGLSAPAATTFGTVPIAYPVDRQVQVRVEGSSPVVFGSARIEVPAGQEDRADDIAVTSDSCRNSTLSEGRSCSITLRAAPTSTEHLVAYVVLPDNTPLGKTEITQAHLDGYPRSTGTYYPVAYRALDTRAVGVPVAAGSTTAVHPDPTLVPQGDASAVVATVTVTGPERAGHITAYSADTRPATSSLNFAAGETRANQVTVPLGPDGTVRLFSSVRTHLVVDIVGYYAANDQVTTHKGMGSQFSLVEPRRLLDTRATTAVAANHSVTLGLDLPGFNEDAAAVAVNLAAVGGTRPGYLRAWDGGSPAPTSSSLNFAPGAVVANSAIVALHPRDGGPPTFEVQNVSAGRTHIVVDIVGVYYTGHPAGLRYRPVPLTRIIDTRTGLGGFSRQIPERQSVIFGPPDRLVNQDTESLVGTVAVVAPTHATYLTVWDGGLGTHEPPTSTVNALPGQTVANSVTVLGTGGLGAPVDHFTLFNNRGETHAIFDVGGMFDAYPPFTSGQDESKYERPHLSSVVVSRN